MSQFPHILGGREYKHESFKCEVLSTMFFPLNPMTILFEIMFAS